MIHYLLNLPSLIMTLVVMIIAAAFSFIALMIIRKKIRWETFRENHEVGGFLFNALGLIYAVLIAFVVFATWEEYKTAQDFCDREANTLQDLYFDSNGLPDHPGAGIREKIIDYTECVINEDWPLLAYGKANPVSKQKLMELWQIYMSIDTLGNHKEKTFFDESVRKLNELTNLRRMRILSSQNHIPSMIWIVIIIGALTSIGFSLFFGTKSLKLQAVMTSLFTMTNAVILLLIMNLDHPFTGDIKITPDAFEDVLNYLENYMNK